MDCLFCKIANKEMKTEFLYEDEHIVCFRDIYPKADTHLLVVPKIHIESTKGINDSHSSLITHIFKTMPKIAEEQGLSDGFRTIINTGKGGGQTIFHLHFHLLGGKLPSM